jgi:hypothetical protein
MKLFVILSLFVATSALAAEGRISSKAEFVNRAEFSRSLIQAIVGKAGTNMGPGTRSEALTLGDALVACANGQPTYFNGARGNAELQIACPDDAARDAWQAVGWLARDCGETAFCLVQDLGTGLRDGRVSAVENDSIGLECAYREDANHQKAVPICFLIQIR